MFPRWFERLANGKGVAALFLFYGAAHGAATLLAGPALALDDDKINIFTQGFAFGYLPDNPPLFEWTTAAVQTLAGPTLLSFVAVKYLFLALTGVFTFLTARALFRDAGWAAFTAASLLLFYQIGYNYHQAFTHSTALVAAVSFFWWALIRLRDRRRAADYALFGASIALGMLSKYVFAAAAGSAALACLMSPTYRARVFNPRIVLSFVVAGLLILPHGLWLADNAAGVAARAGERLGTDDAPYLSRILPGLASAIWAVVSFFLPFALIAGLVIRRRSSALRGSLLGGAEAALPRNAALIGAAGVVVAVLALGIPYFPERYAIAFLFPGVFWAVAIVKASIKDAAAIRWLLIANLGVAALILVVRIFQAVSPGAPFCSSCRQWIPYETLGEALIEAGYSDATVVAYDNGTAGNLRRLFPEMRVLSAQTPFYTPPGGEGPCVIVWSTDLAPAPPEAVLQRLDEATSLEVSARWRRAIRPAEERVTVWRAAKVDHDPGLGRLLCRPRTLKEPTS